MDPFSRRFPGYGWAWPGGTLDQLLKAVLLPEDVALGLARQWLATNDIEAAGFREHRLLASLSERFGRQLAGHEAYPRLVGLQKMLWSRSRLAMREAVPVLEAIVATGHPLMLIKGAAQVARDPNAQRARVSHDIDILVSGEAMPVAFEVLVGRGWAPATGASAPFLRARVPLLRSMNFHRGEFGDVDLHQFAYHPNQRSLRDDEALWARSLEVAYGGVPVRIPAPGDRIAIAIAHGGLDAHAHSDWLVDCARTIRDEEVDWPVFLRTVEDRSIAVPAAIALSYLDREIGVGIDEAVMREIMRLARRAGVLTGLSTLLQAKPRGSYGLGVWLARGATKQHRLWRAERSASGEMPPSHPLWRGRRIGRAYGEGRDALQHPVAPPADGREGPRRLALTLECDLPAVRRRIEFELSSASAPVAQLRYRNTFGRPGRVKIRFDGAVAPAHLEGLRIEARPTRYLQSRGNPEDLARFGAVPASVAGVDWS